MKAKRISGRLAGLALMVFGEFCLACAGLSALPTPAAAQFWDFPFWGGRRSQREWSPWRGWQSGPEQRSQPVDASKAPPPRKQENAPAKTVLVLGDSMADWLGYGLEDALSETPEFGVIRKFRTYSGLMRAESRKDFDWPQAAKEILATEKPDFIVMMVGISDRQAIRDRPAKPNPKQRSEQTKLEGAQPMPIDPQPATTADEAADGDQQKGAEEPTPAESRKAAEATGPMMTYEFRSEKWAEAYGRRIDEMIAVLKSKGVPVLWVGLPPVRGPRASSDVAYLNELYRGHAEKAGIPYVDIWDGFVDETGNFVNRGPDFEGQIRALRAGDGVHFTKAGARKLAHYVEREIHRVMLGRGVPMAMPTPDEPQPDASRAGSPVRPAAGPVVPLTSAPSASEGLLGASAQRPAAADANANRVLVKGEPLTSISGRADDFAWPRPDATPEPEPEPAPAPAARPAKPAAAGAPPAANPAPPAPSKKRAAAESIRHPTSFGDEPPRPEPVRKRPAPASPDIPRPPGFVPLAPIR